MSDLKSQVMSGLKWSVFAKAITQIFSWVSTFLVIRMLTPEDYGIIAIAMIFFTMVEHFSTTGLNAVIIKEQKRESRLSNQIFSFSFYLNVMLSSLIFLLAPIISDAYDAPELINVIYILALINPITSLIVIPAAHLQMEMRFKEKAFIEMAAGLLGATSAFAFATCGYGYWSLIYANYSMIICRAIGYNIYAKSTYSLTFDFKGSLNKLKYAFNIQLGTLNWFIYNKADVAIVGKYLGLEKLGIYSVATEISAIPMSKVASIINEVGFTAFTKAGDKLDVAKGYMLKSIRLISVFAFPVFFGISVVSYELVDFVLGDKWLEVAPIIMILCFAFPLRMISLVYNNYANAMGKSNISLQNGILVSISVISGILVGVQFSLVGLAIGWVLGFVFSLTLIMIRNIIYFKLPKACYIVFFPPMVISVFMWLLVYFSHDFVVQALGDYAYSIVILIVKALIGGLFALPIIALMYGREIYSLILKD